MRFVLPVPILPVLALPTLSLLACGGEEEVETAPVVRPVKIVVFGGGGEGARFTYPGKTAPDRFVDMAFEVTGQRRRNAVRKMFALVVEGVGAAARAGAVKKDELRHRPLPALACPEFLNCRRGIRTRPNVRCLFLQSPEDGTG